MKMRWAEYVARMGENWTEYSSLLGKAEGKRPLGRKNGWVDNIKMDARRIEVDGQDWIDLAQDRGKWGALVNTVIIFGFREMLHNWWPFEWRSFPWS
jgi:hypothetical protein